MTLLDHTTDTTPTTHRRPFRPQTFALALVLTLLVASLAYGFTQHAHGVSVTKQRDTARHSLAGTRKRLHSTLATLTQAQTDLSDANTQLSTCADVTKATHELFGSSENLLNALSNYPNGLDDLNKAQTNIDKVTSLIHDNGFDNIEDFLASCAGTNGTGV